MFYLFSVILKTFRQLISVLNVYSQLGGDVFSISQRNPTDIYFEIPKNYKCITCSLPLNLKMKIEINVSFLCSC